MSLIEAGHEPATLSPPSFRAGATLKSWARRFRRDARFQQLAILGTLLSYGMGSGLIPVTVTYLVACLTGALLAQFLLSRYWASVPFVPWSALITGCSVTLLVRANTPLVGAFAAFLAISLKFTVRWRGDHIFNPANGAIVLLLLLREALWYVDIPSPAAIWITPGQWGTELWIAAILTCLGARVLASACRVETSLAFLGSYGLAMFARALHLGDPLTIPLHRMQSGALLIFAFFMITDPKTTPRHPLARILFAAGVGLAGFVLQTQCYVDEAIFYALFFGVLTVPFLNRRFPASAFSWRHPRSV